MNPASSQRLSRADDKRLRKQSIKVNVIIEGREYRRPYSPGFENPDGTIARPRGRSINNAQWDEKLGAWKLLSTSRKRSSPSLEKHRSPSVGRKRREVNGLQDYLSPTGNQAASYLGSLKKGDGQRKQCKGVGITVAAAQGTGRPDWAGYNLPAQTRQKRKNGMYVRPLHRAFPDPEGYRWNSIDGGWVHKDNSMLVYRRPSVPPDFDGNYFKKPHGANPKGFTWCERTGLWVTIVTKVKGAVDA
jgi:hypothetical protein